MKSTQRRRRHDREVRYSKKAMAKKLRRLADALADGHSVRFSIGGVPVRIPVNVTTEMEYERERTWEEVEIEFRWPKRYGWKNERRVKKTREPRTR